MKREACLICNSRSLEVIIDLGNHAFADTFVPVNKKNNQLVTYNLSCAICSDCGNIQTCSKTDPSDRYSLFDYSYTSSNSKTSQNHWNNFCFDVAKRTKLKNNAFVVEIGSNDGFLLQQFRSNYRSNVLGIDASKHVSDIANKNKIETKVAIFNTKVSENVLCDYGKADLVIANNVFNHSEDPVDFAKAVSMLLKEDGVFVFEVPYWKCSVDSEKIDQIYHEHVSYMTVKSINRILTLANLKIFDVQLVDYHGGSLRVFSKFNNGGQCKIVNSMIKNEEESGIFQRSTYVSLMDKINSKRINLLQKIYDIKQSGGSLVGVGAAAKGNTFLTFLNLDSSTIDYVTDASKHKQGKITPLTSIPICGDEIFSEYDEVYAIILSWNISNNLKEKLLQINSKIEFLVFDDF
jgi:SAM-dependent methyltransferase